MTERHDAHRGTVTGREYASPLEDVLETALGEPVEDYVDPISDDEIRAFDEELDAVEPAHTAAAAKLRELFAG